MSTLLDDDWSEANGTNIHGKAADVGGNWTVQTGTMDVQGNKASNAEAAATSIATMSSGVAAGTITVPVIPKQTLSVAGVCVRFDDTSNYWYCAVDVANDLLVIVKVEAGAPTTEDSDPLTVDIETEYSMTVTLTATSIAVTVGAASASVSNTWNNGELLHGLYTTGNGDTFGRFTMTGEFDAAKFSHLQSAPPQRQAISVASY